MTKHAVFLAVLFLCALCGCEDYEFKFGACDGPNPAPPPDCPAPAPAPAPEETCSGQCVSLPPLGWSLPALLWYGPEHMAPECPADRAGVVGYQGYADLKAPACFGCSCEAPTGSCELSPVLTAYADPGCTGGETDWSAPDPWDGVCVDTNPPLLGARSVKIDPLTMTESECVPKTHDTPLAGEPTWGTFARACLGNGFTMPCPDPGDYCAPTAAPPPDGFSQCVFQKGDFTCPLDYPSKHVFYEGAIDQRECTECTCGAPEGGECTARVSVYKEAGCTNLKQAMFVVDSIDSQCANITAGTPLVSKDADQLWYAPGVCEPSGGEPAGPVELLGPGTFCCQE